MIDQFKIEAIKNILLVFKFDTRYQINFEEVANERYNDVVIQLYSTSDKLLLAEFSGNTNRLVEHAFRNSFNEIIRKIEIEESRLRENFNHL